MKGVVIVGLLFCLLPAPGIAGFGLPWFHTRPKPVLFDEPPAAERKAPARKPAAYSRNSSEQTRSLAKANAPNERKKLPAGQIKPETAQ